MAWVTLQPTAADVSRSMQWVGRYQQKLRELGWVNRPDPGAWVGAGIDLWVSKQSLLGQLRLVL